MVATPSSCNSSNSNAAKRGLVMLWILPIRLIDRMLQTLVIFEGGNWSISQYPHLAVERSLPRLPRPMGWAAPEKLRTAVRSEHSREVRQVRCRGYGGGVAVARSYGAA